jgi:hypothetical protein
LVFEASQNDPEKKVGFSPCGRRAFTVVPTKVLPPTTSSLALRFHTLLHLVGCFSISL